MSQLRAKITKLAREVPEIRKHLIPLLQRTAAPLTVEIHTGEKVLAKNVKGKATAKTFANRTQAKKVADEMGSGWVVVQRGRPWYVAKKG